MVHLEVKSTNEEEGVHSEDPDGTEGTTEEFIVCLARAVKDAQQPRPLHPGLPLAGWDEGRCTFKPERGDGTEEGRLIPSRKDGHAKGCPRIGCPRHKTLSTDSLLES